MYPPPELVAQAGPFGGADVVQQRGTLAELAQVCQTWGAALAGLHTTPTRGRGFWRRVHGRAQGLRVLM
jgi:hypothetical protein